MDWHSLLSEPLIKLVELKMQIYWTSQCVLASSDYSHYAELGSVGNPKINEHLSRKLVLPCSSILYCSDFVINGVSAGDLSICLSPVLLYLRS